MSENEKTVTICPSCGTPNETSEIYCQKCSAHINDTTSLDPMKSIYDEGFLFRKAVSDRPKFIVLLGVWILFIPWIIGTIFIEIEIFRNWDGLPSYVFFLLGVALFVFAAYMIFSVTKNYYITKDSYKIEQEKKQLKDENRLRAKAKRQAKMKNKVS